MLETNDYEKALNTLEWMEESGVKCHIKYGSPLQCLRTGSIIVYYQVVNSMTGELVKILEG